MKPIPVLFQHVVNPDAETDSSIIPESSVYLIVTAKAYFDQHHALSDGPSYDDPDYENIQAALESVGYEETSESMYDPPKSGPLSDQDLINRMAEKGFTFIPTDFDALLP